MTIDPSIATRNGSGDPVKQHVWGTRYIDELVQVGLNDWADSPGPQVMDRFYWVCQDSNYNVLGVVDAGAVLAERYEYTPCPGYAPRREDHLEPASARPCLARLMAATICS